MIAATLHAELIIPGTPEWTASRSTGIGASEGAAACGLSEYKTPSDIYFFKRGLIEDAEENARMRMGKLLEPVIIAEFERERGVMVTHPVSLQRHPDKPFIMATPDGLVEVEDREGLECKATNWRQAKKLGEEGSDFVFDEWVIQCQQGMYVTDLAVWNVAVLVDGYKLRTFKVHRNESLIAGIVAGVSELWERIQNQDPPDPDWRHPRMTQLVKELHGTVDESLAVELSEHATLCWELQRHVGQRIKRLESLQDALKANVLYEMGGASIARLPGHGKLLRRSVVNVKEHVRKGSSYVKLSEAKDDATQISEPKSHRRKSHLAERKALFALGVDRCRWCRKQLTIRSSTLEHVIPLGQGGQDRIENYDLACAECNQKRADSGLDPKYVEAK